MAENEIAKHIEAAYKAAKSPGTHWLHKLKEVLIEIAIIVFAVSISIWFHNWSDSLHEHKEEREFLLGMKKDLEGDIATARSDSTFYYSAFVKLQYFKRIGAGEPLNADTGSRYQGVFFSNTSLEPNISRYEALKGSGKFSIIENQELLNQIINLHEETIKHVQSLDGFYTDYINRMSNFIQEHGQLNPAGNQMTNVRELLALSQMRLLMGYGTDFIYSNVLRWQDSCIVQSQQLIRQIDEELK